VGGFIGPFPFGFASNPGMLGVVVGLGLAGLLVFLALNCWR
jgi:hypothetical protein